MKRFVHIAAAFLLGSFMYFVCHMPIPFSAFKQIDDIPTLLQYLQADIFFVYSIKSNVYPY